MDRRVQPETPDLRGIKLLGLQYGQYLTEHHGSAPKDEAALRQYLQANLGELATYGVKSADDLLNASRDGAPLKIVCGSTLAPPEHPDVPWAAYESQGVNGKRLACNVRGGLVEISAEESRNFFPPMILQSEGFQPRCV